MRCIAIALGLLTFCVAATSVAVAQTDASYNLQETSTFHAGGGKDESNFSSSAQGVHVLTLRSPSFGSFYCGSGGGKIVVHQDGTRSGEGDVILMNSGVSIAPALFEISCEPYIMIQLLSDSYFTLHGQDGHELRAKIVATDPPFPFVAPSNAKQGFVVAASVCLEIDPGLPLAPGNYDGSFQLNWTAE